MFGLGVNRLGATNQKPFSPASLFNNGEAGVWYDPSSINTLYQDSQGVTPVTAVGQPVGLMLDKSEGLKQGPELVTNGTFDTNYVGWTPFSIGSGSPTYTVDNQKLKVNLNGSYDVGIDQSFSTVAGRFYAFSLDVDIVTAFNYSQLVGAFIGTRAGSTQSLTANFSSGSHSFIIQATSSTTHLRIRSVSGSNTQGVYTVDNVSVTEIQGSHATQPTSTKRPIYARHPEGGIRNLLNYTEQFDNGYWQKLRGGLTPFESPVGDTSAFKFQQFAGETVVPVVRANATVIAGKVYTFSAFVKKGTRNRFSLHEQATTTGIDSYFDILNGTVSSQGSGHIARIQDAGNGWYRCSITYTSAFSASKAHDLRIGATNSTTVPDDQGFTYIWGAQVEEATEASNYQKVVTDIDVTESGVGEVYYLKFDGTDDGMMINNLTSPSTPLTALFGHQLKATNKWLLDIASGRTLFGGNNSNRSVFDGGWIQGPPETFDRTVLTYDAVQADLKIRIDGTVESTSGAYDENPIDGQIGLFQSNTQGGSYVAGNMYQIILRAAESTDEEIAKAETYVANKTGLKAQVDGIATLDLNFGNNTYTAKNSNGGVI